MTSFTEPARPNHDADKCAGTNSDSAEWRGTEAPTASPRGLFPERIPLKTLTVGTSISGSAVVRDKQEATTKAGDPYLTVCLAHRDGEAKAKVWREQVPIWNTIPVGRGVYIEALVKPGYQGAPPELALARVTPLPEGHAIEREMHPLSPVPQDLLLERLDALRRCLTPSAEALVDAVLRATNGAFFEGPAAMVHHHAYLYGLLEHSVEVAELAVALARHSPAGEYVDSSVLIVGALLHDVGKISEYSWTEGPIRMDTHTAAMTYHTVSGAIFVERTWQRERATLEAFGVTDRDIAHLQHVIASHHEKKEYGSVVGPCSLEALVVHLADECSAKLRSRLDDLTSAMPDAEGWVHPTGWRKPPVLTFRRDLVIAARASSHDIEDAAEAFGDGANVSAYSTHVANSLEAVRAAVHTGVRLRGVDNTASPASEAPNHHQSIQCPRPGINSADANGTRLGPDEEDLVAYVAYLISRDAMQWDPRRRLRVADARTLAWLLRAALSPERRNRLDVFLREDRERPDRIRTSTARE